MESHKNVELLNFAKHELEAQAKKIQEKLGGSESRSVLTFQIVLPSAIGKNTEQVRFRCDTFTQCWIEGRGKEGNNLYYCTKIADANSYLSPCEPFLFQVKNIALLRL